MKTFTILSFLLLTILCSCSETKTSSEDPGEWLHRITPLVVSHRATISPDIAENSLKAFNIAHKEGILMHETDLRESSDGELLVIHDHSLERTTMGMGHVAELTWDQLRQIQLRDSQENIPHFHNFLEYARENDLLLMLDLKGVDIQNVARSLERYNMHHKVLMLTFSRETSLEALQLDPPVVVSVLITSMEDYYFYETNATHNDLWVAYLNQSAPMELFEQVSAKGRKIVSDTMGRIDREAMEKGAYVYRDFIRERGIDIIVSDYPVQVMQALEMEH